MAVNPRRVALDDQMDLYLGRNEPRPSVQPDEIGTKRRLYDQMMEYARAQAAKEVQGRYGKDKVSATIPGVKDGTDIDEVLQNPDLKEVGDTGQAATTPEMVAQQLEPTEPLAKDKLAENESAIAGLDADLLIRLLNEKKK